jgi:hypothetical protein
MPSALTLLYCVLCGRANREQRIKQELVREAEAELCGLKGTPQLKGPSIGMLKQGKQLAAVGSKAGSDDVTLFLIRPGP